MSLPKAQKQDMLVKVATQGMALPTSDPHLGDLGSTVLLGAPPHAERGVTGHEAGNLLTDANNQWVLTWTGIRGGGSQRLPERMSTWL